MTHLPRCQIPWAGHARPHRSQQEQRKLGPGCPFSGQHTQARIPGLLKTGRFDATPPSPRQAGRAGSGAVVFLVSRGSQTRTRVPSPVSTQSGRSSPTLARVPLPP